jgi:hypothetical protein
MLGGDIYLFVFVAKRNYSVCNELRKIDIKRNGAEKRSAAIGG